MTHASLFSGIGGFDLAAEWMGWQNIFHCEWNPFGQRVLKHHFPNSKSYHDITKTNFSIHRGTIDILTGGFPCQPYSSAGKRLGKEDERHLWPEMLRTIQEVQPRWVVGENVRGLTNWNGGLVFDEVQADLEAKGYEVTPFLLPACAVNAPHRRDRIWFVAYSNNNGNSSRFGQVQGENGEISERNNNAQFSNSSQPNDASNSYCNGQQQERGYDGSSENVNGSDNEKFRTTNSKDINGCSSYGNFKGGYRFSKGFGFEGIYQKDKATNSNGVYKMDKNDREQKGVVGEIEFKHNEGGALVQDGQSGVQLSNNRGLDNFKKPLSSSNGFGLQNDLPRIEGMERNVTNTNSEGYTRSSSGRIQEMEGRTAFEHNKCSRSGERNDWVNFPTQPPICGGDDGIPRELDSITFSKWRNESIKAYGNAIVPQVAHQIFKAIQQYEDNYTT